MQPIWLSTPESRTLMRVYGTRRRLFQWTTAAQTARIFQRRNGRAQCLGTDDRQPASRHRDSRCRDRVEPVGTACRPAHFCWPGSWPHRSPTGSAKRRMMHSDELNEAERSQLRTWRDEHGFTLNSTSVPRTIGCRRITFRKSHWAWLPIAHRPPISACCLLSAVAAYDFGYESLMSTAIRLRNTFETLAQMERHQGHFLNWYDTRSLDPLPPRYISMVDNGNLAGCLVALRQSLAEMAGPACSAMVSLARAAGHTGQLWKMMIDHLEAPPPGDGGDLCAIPCSMSKAKSWPYRMNQSQWIPALLRLIEYQMPALLKQLQMLVSTDGRRYSAGYTPSDAHLSRSCPPSNQRYATRDRYTGPLATTVRHRSRLP